MKFFYSSVGGGHTRLGSMGMFLLGGTALFLFLCAGAFVFFVLKYIFVRSVALGILFLFFGLPLLVKVLFIIYLSALTLLTSLFSLGGVKHASQQSDMSGEDIIDVKGRILK